MANKKINATATLFLDTKDAKNDAKRFVNDLKQKLSEIETAADKMSVFKDMVAYIAQVDRALASLKANNKDAFDHMFDGLDINLKQQLESLFGVNGAQLGQLDVLRNKLGELTLKSSIKDVKAFAKEINLLFTSIGINAPFDDVDSIFHGRTTTEYLQKLGSELAKFATVWENLNFNFSGNFGFGNGSSSGGDGIVSEIQMLIDNIEKKNKELLDAKERFDKILKEFNNINKDGISDSYKIDLTEESVKSLTLEYDKLQSELESADTSSEGFYNTLTNLIEISLKLKRAFSDISADDGLKKVFQNASAGEGTGEATLFGLLSRYARTKDPVNKDVRKIIDRGDLQNTINTNNALIEELKTSNDINAVIQKRIELYNQLKAKLHEYNIEQNKEFDTDEEEDESFNKLERMEKEIANLTGATKRLNDIQNVLADLSEDGVVLDDVLQKLYRTLGMETPGVFKERLDNMVVEAKAAMTAIDDINDSGTGGKNETGVGVGGGSGSGTGKSITADVDFTSLENTIKAEAASIINKLDGNTFKVEVVKDHTEDIKSSINDILGSVRKISEHYNIDKNKSDVDNMKKNLLQLLDVVNTHNAGRTSDGKYQSQELGIALLSDGSFSVNYGDKGRVSWDHMAESLIANLNKTLLGDIHSHPLHELFKSNNQTFTSDALSGAHGDLGAFRYSQALGSKIAGMITGNVLRVLDLSSVTPKMMANMQVELDKIEQRYTDSGLYSKYFGRDKNGRFGAKMQSTLEDQHQITKLVEGMMYEAFQNVGYSKDYIDNTIFKKYNLTDDAQLTDLATRLVQLVSGAEQAIPPMDRLAEIITKFGGDTTSAKAKTLFEAYDKGELKASDVFNGIMAGTKDPNRVSESAIQSLLNINNAKQTSPIETLLTNISSILSNISTIVGNIDANTRLDSEQQLNNAIKDISDLKSGIINDGLSRGVEHIYNDKDATKYRYSDAETRAISAINDFVDDLKIKRESDGFTFSESATKDALELVNKFKMAFTYLQDFGKQTELFTGGRNDLGLYVDPSSGKILDTYDTASEMLTNSNVLDALINQLKSIRDKEFDSTETHTAQQLQPVFEKLSMVVDNLSAALSNFNGITSEQKLPKMDDDFNSFDEGILDNNIDTSKDISNLDVLVNKVRDVAVEIKELAIEVDGIIDGIVQKVNSLVGGLNNLITQCVDIKNPVVDNNVSNSNPTSNETKDSQPKDPFKDSLRNQKNAFNEYRKNLEGAQYVSDELREKLNQLAVQLQQVDDSAKLKDFKTAFDSVKKEITILENANKTIGSSFINSAKSGLLNTFNGLTLDQQKELKPELDKAIEQLERYKLEVQEGKVVELNAINETTSALRQKLEVYKEANKEAKKTSTSQKTNVKFGDTASINATAKYNSLTRVATSDQFASSSVVLNALFAYEESYNRMIDIRDRLRNSDVIDDSDREAFKAATTECNNYAKALDKIIQNSLKLKGNKANPDDYMLGSDFDYSDIDSRKAALADFVKQMYGVDVAATDFKDNWNKVVFAVDNGDGTFTQMSATFTEARNEIVAMAGDTKKAQGAFANFFDELKGKFKSIGAYLVASFSFHEVWSVIRQGINYVREIDSALTELKKVTNETDASYAQFLQDMSKTGSVIGATVKDLTTMAADWSRLGYSMADAAKLAESTAILLNVSEFKDANEASEALISTMQAFQYTADESQHVVDILNEVGNNYAVSSDGIATALQDSASALMEGGNNLEQAVALVAAANKVVQDPNSVGK